MGDVAYAILASVPGEPADVPVSDDSVTSTDVIKVSYAQPAPPDDGGSPILTYELQMDDGAGGDFVSLTGFSPYSMIQHFTVVENVSKGRVHRFRYRAKNAVGWGPFSQEASILAASPPSAPGPPSFSHFSDDTLFVEIFGSEDNGGTAILAMELWRDAGDDFASSFSQVSDYDGWASTYGFTAATDGLEAGKTYRLKTRSENAVGYSGFSLEAFIAFGDVAGAPGQPQRVSSTRTSLTVSWTAPETSSADLPVLGFVLNMDDGMTKDLKPVFIG